MRPGPGGGTKLGIGADVSTEPTALQPLPDTVPSTERLGPLVLRAAAVLFFISVLRFAWISDDGFITARSLSNLLSGHGLGTNPGHRVQTFTSPLWMLLCLPLQALTGSPYHGLMLAGLGASAGFAFVVVRSFRLAPWVGALVLVAATASPSFLTYSTSGLENSLTHLLLALFCVAILRDKPLAGSTFFIGGLIVLCRFDYVLLIAPTIAVALLGPPGAPVSERLRAARSSLLPSLLRFLGPLVAWLAFATIYYGFPFPNTAYAKLNTAIPFRERFAQGLAYLVDGVYRDPVLALLIVLAALVAITMRKSRQSQLLIAGVGLYLLYVVWIGGDFMGGRFLTAALVVSAIVLGHLLADSQTFLALLVAATFLIGLPSFADRRVDRGTECHVSTTGIVDERGCYVEHTGLPVNLRQEKWRTHGYLEAFRKAAEGADKGVVVFDLIGLAAFGDSRPLHIVEHFALSEPLLARIRYKARPGWRPGHYHRDLPAGYLDTLKTGQNTIEDRCLRDLHDRLAIVTKGPLFSWARFASIASLNFGRGTCSAPGG